MEIESVVSSGIAKEFITQMFVTWVKESQMTTIGNVLRKSGALPFTPAIFC